MKNFSYMIKDELGIHARPAGLLVKEAKKYECNITIKKEDKAADMTRLMMVMALGVKKGDIVIVAVDGEQEDVVATNLAMFFEEIL